MSIMSNFTKVVRVPGRVRTGLLKIIGVFIIVCFLALFTALNASARSGDTNVVSVQYYTGDSADPKYHTLDLYIPKKTSDKSDSPEADYPVVVFIHGGAWHIGDKSNDGPVNVAKTLAENGIICANINYRLSPSVKHPVHVEDVARAVRWVYNNISNYGGDPDKLFISGHSAGAHLAALVTLDTKYLQAESVPMSSIRGVIPISGPFDLTRTSESFKKFCKLDGAFGTDATVLKDASPFSHIRSDAPPFLCFAAQFDSEPVREDAQKLASDLKVAGVDAESIIVKWRNHMTILRKFGSSRDSMLDEMLEFIKNHSR
jgi:arylformamidase